MHGVSSCDNCTESIPVKPQYIGGARQGRPVTCKGKPGIRAPTPRTEKGSIDSD